MGNSYVLNVSLRLPVSCGVEGQSAAAARSAATPGGASAGLRPGSRVALLGGLPRGWPALHAPHCAACPGTWPRSRAASPPSAPLRGAPWRPDWPDHGGDAGPPSCLARLFRAGLGRVCSPHVQPRHPGGACLETNRKACPSD